MDNAIIIGRISDKKKNTNITTIQGIHLGLCFWMIQTTPRIIIPSAAIDIDNFETTAVPVINAAISPYPQGPTMDNTDKAPNISIQIKYFLRFSNFPPNGLKQL